jgi:hypothetical protein
MKKKKTLLLSVEEELIKKLRKEAEAKTTGMYPPLTANRVAVMILEKHYQNSHY